MPEAVRPYVATFYSYKGGVGRTLLASNVAVALCREGKTLVWDMDVEAPGLQFISALKSPSKIRHGFLEWLHSWQQSHQPRGAEAGEASEVSVGRVSSSELKSFVDAIQPTSISDLYCLPALSEKSDPAQLYQGVDWSWFQYEPAQALRMFDELLKHLHAQGFRHVVIDSRTGFTDLGALLVGLLPDVSVLVGGYGEQNLHGLSRIWTALKTDRPELALLRQGRPLPQIELVASPIPEHNSGLLAAGREKWAGAFGLQLSSVLEIAFDPELPFTEKLLVSAAPDRRVAKQYLKVAAEVSKHFARLEVERTAVSGIDQDGGSISPGERESLEAFERKVASLLKLLGYEVESSADGDHGYDLIAKTSVGFENLQYLVECKAFSRPVGVEAVEMLAASVTRYNAVFESRGMVVSGSDFTQAARSAAQSLGVRLFTPADLEAQLLDAKRYLVDLARSFEQSPSLETYLVPRSETVIPMGESKRRVEDTITYGVNWSQGKANPIWIVVAPPGGGKSAFASALCYSLARAAMDNPMAPIPILVRLRDTTRKKLDIGLMLADAWQAAGGEQKSPEVFQYLWEQGRLVALFDGLDELSSSPGRGQGQESELLAMLGAPESSGKRAGRAMVTCREAALGLTSQRVASRDPSIRKLLNSPDLRVSRLSAPSRKQVTTYLEQRLGNTAALGALKHLQTQHPELLQASFLNLAAAASALSKTPDVYQDLNVGRLYLAAYERWLNFSPKSKGSGWGVAADVIKVLSRELWLRGAQSIGFKELFSIVRADHSPRSALFRPSDLEALMSAPLFEGSIGAGYSFVHRGLQEFCLAWSIVNEARLHRPRHFERFLNIPRISDGVASFVCDLVEGNEVSLSRIAQPIRLLLQPASKAAASDISPNTKVNLLVLGHALAVREGGRSADLGSVRAACERYIPDGARLEKLELSGLDLSGVRLRGANLEESDLSRANLTGADLRGSDLDLASLRHATIVSVHFGGASLVGADLRGARLRNVNMENADARNSDWQGASVERVLTVGARLTDANLINTSEDRDFLRQAPGEHRRVDRGMGGDSSG